MKKKKNYLELILRITIGLLGFAIILIVLPLQLYKERLERKK